MSVTCSICCEEIDFSKDITSVLNCGHLFHQACLLQWLDTSQTCPECRRKVGKKGFVKKIFPKVSSDDKLSYENVSNETRDLFKVYEDQTKNLQKMFLEKFVSLEKSLSREKSSHANTKNMLKKEKSNYLSLLSELQALEVEKDNINALKKASNQLQSENDSLKKKNEALTNLVQNYQCLFDEQKPSTSKLCHILKIKKKLEFCSCQNQYCNVREKT